MYFVKQLNNDDCGFACLKMVMAKEFARKEFLYLKQNLNHGPYTYKQLIDIAKMHGLRMNGYLYNDPNELFVERPKNVMVSLQGKGGGKHMVVIKAIALGRVYIKDPYLGRYSLSKKKFLKLWDKTLIRIDDDRGYQKLPYKPYKLKNSKIAILILLRILGLISAILGVFYMDNGIPIYISITLLVFSFAFEILYRIYSLSMMKRIDKDLLKTIKKCECKGEEFIATYSRYKEIDVMLYPSFAFSLVMSLFIVVIFVLNEVFNFIPIIFVILVSALDSLIVTPIFEAKRKAINVKENALKNSNIDDNFILNFKTLSQNSYDFGKKYMLKKLFLALMIVSMVIFYMYLSGISDISYIVFYSFGYWYLSNNMCYLLTFKNRLDSLTFYRLRLMNIINDEN